MVANLAKAHANGHLEERLADYAKPKLLIVDGLGYLPFEPDAAHLSAGSWRYAGGRMLVTSNKAVGEWANVFGDTVMATAILDRTACCTTATLSRFAGESYRLREKLREKRRAGLLQKVGPTQERPSTATLGMRVFVSLRGGASSGVARHSMPP